MVKSWHCVGSMFVRDLLRWNASPHAPKGQPQVSPGQRPGTRSQPYGPSPERAKQRHPCAALSGLAAEWRISGSQGVALG